ncbi:hypothetical protein QT654_20585 [Xanthomonas citri pv. citri]
MKTKTWNQAQTAAQKAQRERIIAIMARVKNEDAIADIARDLGVSRQRVSQIVNRERARSKVPA